jgi:SagB-type dehydrogenase family enzyme
MFSGDGMRALFGRSEGADVQDLLLPSELYHENTKNRRTTGEMLRRGAEDPVVGATLRRAEARVRRLHDLVQFGSKSYPHLPRVALPASPPQLGLDLAVAIHGRATDRRLSGAPVSLESVATLLELGYGVVRYAEPGSRRLPRRAVPSGGALYPLEVYVLATAAEGLEPGVYHFEGFSHVLEQISRECLVDRIRVCFLDGDVVAAAALTIAVTAVLPRLRHKYGDMAYRLAMLEAGHVGQNVCLVATALGLGVCPLAGFIDDAVNDLLVVDGVDETVVYTLAIGQRRAVPSSGGPTP